MNEHDPLVRGIPMGDQFTFHTLNVGGPAMIHVTESYRPEVVLFGKDQKLSLPLLLDAGPSILVNGQSGGKIIVSRFAPGEEPEQRTVSTGVSEVVRAIVELGGTYPDVVQALQQAKHDGALKSRFLVDALPQSGRRYDREAAKYEALEDGFDAPPTKQKDSPLDVSTPLPDLFTQQR
jgi:hypothetical protein